MSALRACRCRSGCNRECSANADALTVAGFLDLGRETGLARTSDQWRRSQPSCSLQWRRCRIAHFRFQRHCGPWPWLAAVSTRSRMDPIAARSKAGKNSSRLLPVNHLVEPLPCSYATLGLRRQMRFWLVALSWRSFCARTFTAALAVALLLATLCQSQAADPEAKRVMMLHSFGLRFRPWTDYSEAFRAEMSQRTSVEFQDHSLLNARRNSDKSDASFRVSSQPKC